MKLSIVFPMFWGRQKGQPYGIDDYYYDHPTPLGEEGTIPALFESMKVLKDREFDVVAVAGGSHPSLDRDVERQAGQLLSHYAERAGVELHFFSYSHLEKFHAYLRENGRSDLQSTVGLVGYSPLRNACLVAAQILGSEIAVSIDDDCVFIDETYLTRIRERLSSSFEGERIKALCGPYITAKDGIYLDVPQAAYSVYWDNVERMNDAFRHYIVENPGLKEMPFAIMGNIAVHRDFFAHCPLDPPLQRGEDSDWVMNAHILGERFIMDTELTIKHCPPSRPHPTWRPMREDIHRFRYQQAKIANSEERNGYHRLLPERYLPFPGTFYRDDFMSKVTNACQLLALDYLIAGEPDNAREALNNIQHAHTLGIPDFDPFESFVGFQKNWEQMMGLVSEQRDSIRQQVFGR